MLSTINDYLFQELGFTGNEKNYYDPENSYLNRVLDRRTGNPINLCLLYILIGRRLRLPVAGIGCRAISSAAINPLRPRSTLTPSAREIFDQGRLRAIPRPWQLQPAG